MRNIVRSMIGLLVLLCALAALAAAVSAEFEPNNDFATANPITVGTHAGDVTLTTDEDDYYSFTVTAGQGILLSVTSPGNDYIYMTLHTWESMQVFQLKSKGSVPESRAYYTANETGTHDWYVQVGADRVSGPYVLNLTLIEPDDAGTHLDVGGSFVAATVVATGATYKGHVADLDGADYYAFLAGGGDIIRLELWGYTSADNITLELFTPDRTSVLDLRSRNQGAVSRIYYTANETPLGLWYAEVYFGTQAGAYDFNVTLVHQDDAGSGDDAGDGYATASVMTPGSHHGVVQNLDHADMFRFWAGQGDFFRVELLAQTTGDFITAELRDKDENLLFVVKSKLQTAHDGSLYTKNETPPAWWYVKVYFEAEAGSYELTLTIARQNDAGSGLDAAESAAGACVIAPGIHAGHVQDLDDFDYYKFQAGFGDVVHVVITCDVVGDYIYATLQDLAETTLFEIKAAGNDPGAGAYLTASETATTWWLIKVNMVSKPGDYSLNLSLVKQDDAGSGADAAGAIMGASMVPVGPFSGQLGDLDTVDYFKFAVKGAWTVTVNVTNAQAVSCAVAIIGDPGTQVPIGTIVSSLGVKGSGTWQVPTGVGAGALWYIKVVGSTGWVAGPYALELYIKETPPDQETPMITFTDPGSATTGQPIKLVATVTDNVGVAAVTVFFKIDNATVYTPMPMDAGPNSQYTATIPGPEIKGTTFKFYIFAQDTSGNDRSHGSAASPRSVGVVPADTVPPVITYKPPTSVTKDKALTISMTVTDNIGIKDVTLYFKIDDEVTWSTLNMTQDGSKWVATVPAATMKGKTLHYYVLARDTSNVGEFYGTDAAPKSISIKEAKSPGFGAAAAAAAAALGAALAVASSRRRR